MARKSKRMRSIEENIEPGKLYGFDDAVKMLKEFSSVKFSEGVDVSVNLGVDPRKSDQVVRGATLLPHGSGRSVKVAVFAQGPDADAAEAAGADKVGFNDLAEAMKAGDIAYDVIIATPDAMPVVGKLGQLLGPRGLMPNPKVGTVTKDVATAVTNAKSGQVRYRTDRAGIIHTTIGKIEFDSQQLKENLAALLQDLQRLKPSVAKGIYLKKISLTSTMGPGLAVELSSIV
jgi:large subunit ribosomal protein L1